MIKNSAIIILTCLNFIFPVLSEAREMTVLEEKLYQYVLNSQIVNHTYPSYNGSWPTKSRVDHLVDFETTSSFEIVQTLLFLKSIRSHISVSNPAKLDQVFERGYLQLDNYLRESAQTNEPLGSVNFYPIRDHSKMLRGFPSFTRDLAFLLLGYSLEDANLPNDWDCGARTYVLLHDRANNTNWSSGFANNVGKWTDINRSVQHSSESWKPKNSGAFLTWAEPDISSAIKTRILGGRNDVDCVVNLNILEALGVNESHSTLPEHTLVAKNKTCKLLNAVINEGAQGSINRCSVYYQRPSQVMLSYARASKAMDSGENCLNSSKSDAVRLSLELAQLAMQKFADPQAVLTNAELVITLKSLIPENERNNLVLTAIRDLIFQLQSSIRVYGNYALVDTKDSMYAYSYKGWPLEFRSQAYTNAIVLLALSMP